jgi:hypothetical protein
MNLARLPSPANATAKTRRREGRREELFCVKPAMASPVRDASGDSIAGFAQSGFDCPSRRPSRLCDFAFAFSFLKPGGEP